MTKPKFSEEPVKVESKASTAKELLSGFDPKESSDSEDEETQIYEPTAKKKKENTPKKSYLQKYKKEWENKPELKNWLSESIHGNTYFYCRFCKKDYKCSISDIQKHASSKKHSIRATLPTFQAEKFKFRGLLCPVLTPFSGGIRLTPDISFKNIPKYANFLEACGVKGILVNDIIGEGMSLTIRERMDIVEAWISVCEKTNQFLMVQIGGATLKDVIEMAKHAKNKEVGAVVLMPDLYNKPKDHLDLIRYIKFIAEFLENIPILYHHNPEKTGVKIDICKFLLDLTGEIDSFVGVIFSTNDIHQATAALNLNREKFTIFMGTDEGILGGVASGFTCIMSSCLNLLPKLVQSIFQDAKSGNLKNAQKSQQLLNKAFEVIFTDNSGVAGLKAATEILTSTCSSLTREPLHTLYDSSIKKLQDNLRVLGII